jgi:hypothetical protein
LGSDRGLYYHSGQPVEIAIIIWSKKDATFQLIHFES